MVIAIADSRTASLAPYVPPPPSQSVRSANQGASTSWMAGFLGARRPGSRAASAGAANPRGGVAECPIQDREGEALLGIPLVPRGYTRRCLIFQRAVRSF